MIFKLEAPEHQWTARQRVVEVLLSPSFGVGFNPTFLTLGKANVFILLSLNQKVPIVLFCSPYGDSEMARNGFEDDSKWCVAGNTCSSINEAGFVASRTYVHNYLKKQLTTKI